MSALATVDELVALLQRLSATASPEAPGFTELDHALQCAHLLAGWAPRDVTLQVAGLVHDIGHQFGDDDAHGRLGAEATRDLLGPRVAVLVEQHVPAKRYLVTVSPEYAEALSAVSVATLAAQGGPLTPGDVAAFYASPHWSDALTLRRADDAAKVPGRQVPGLDHWLPALRRVAEGAR